MPSQVARLVGDHVLIARAEEERAIALKGQRDRRHGNQCLYGCSNSDFGVTSRRIFLCFVDRVTHYICAQRLRGLSLKIRLLKGVFMPDLKPVDGGDRISPRAVQRSPENGRHYPTGGSPVADRRALDGRSTCRRPAFGRA